MGLNLIAAVDNNWAIGYENNLLARIPEDMKFFVEKTKGNIIILGRKTLESFKGGKPLKDRINIVITKNKNYECEGAVICHSIEEAINEAQSLTKISESNKEIFVCGGEQIYKQFLNYCDTAYITKIHSSFMGDAFFPNLDELNEWEVQNIGDIFVSDDKFEFRFTKFIKKLKYFF